VVSPNESSTIHEWTEAALRFRAAGMAVLVLACVGWLLWFTPFDDLLDRSGTPLGGDFVMLYVAGQVVASGQSQELYDDQLNQRRSNALFPGMDPTYTWPFRYPPTVAAVMAPFSRLPFTTAWAMFMALQVGLLLSVVGWMGRNLKSLQAQSYWLWGVAGCPVVIETIVGGQSSLIALACVVGTVHFMQLRRFVLAGAILALACYKPNVLALFMVGCVIAHPRLLRGLIPTALMGVVVAISSCGVERLGQYLSLTIELASTTWTLETPMAKVQGLAPFFQAAWPAHGKLLCLLLGLLASVCIAVHWRRKRVDERLALGLLLAINALFNPYVPIYDLVLLIAALALGAEASWSAVGVDSVSAAARSTTTLAVSPRDFQWLAGWLFIGPHLSQGLVPLLGWQVFPIVLVAMLAAICIAPKHVAVAPWTSRPTSTAF